MTAEKVVVGASAKDTMAALSGIIGDVCLVVDSEAGSLGVFEHLAICNAIKVRGGVTVELVGVALPLIAMCADRVMMNSKSMLVITAPFMSVIGGPAEYAEAADLLEKTKAAMKDCYASRPKVDKDAIFAMLDDGEDHFLDASESKRLGLVDEIC